MPTYEMTAGAAAKFYARLGDVHQRASVAEQQKTLTEARRSLVKHSSGTLSTAEQRRMGHPFAVRAPQTPIDSTVVNDQGGPFRKSWKLVNPVVMADGTVVSRVTNVDPKSGFMRGTKSMIHRGIVEAVEDEIGPGRRRRYAYFFHKEAASEIASIARDTKI